MANAREFWKVFARLPCFASFSWHELAKAMHYTLKMSTLLEKNIINLSYFM
jgi:hypothetical protein